MSEKKRFILSMFALALIFHLHGQSYSPGQIELAERLDSLAKNAAPEIAYIQTSKDIYETGEDLWFKVYLLNSQTFIPSLLSKTLYLQLLNEESKKAVWQEKYEIQNGFANGSVYLETSLPEGYYLLEVYSPNSFLNDSSEFFAVKRILVKTDITTKSTGIQPATSKTKTIQFDTFPEGGNLISGIQNRLAFKAVNTNGMPVEVKGTLFEDTVPFLKFRSMHAGMGSFSFTPVAGRKYHIHLSEPETDSTFLLPEINSTGLTMQLVGRDDNTLSFKISQNEAAQKDYYLRVQCRGVVYGMAIGHLSNELYVKLPLDGLPQGIAEITLFNNNLIPVAERLVFVNKNQNLDITAELEKELFPTRGKVTLKISVKDENGQAAVANLGVSVFDRLYQDQRDSNNILTHFYLSTQLKGRIYNPSFYFNNNNDSDEALDLLMLTQGWRKYVWNEENLKKNSIPGSQVIFDGTEGRLIAHSIWEKRRNEKIYVIAYSPNLDKKKVLIQVDSAGRFSVTPDLLKRWEGDFVYLKPLWRHSFPPPIKLSKPFETINQVMEGKEVMIPLQNLALHKEEASDLSLYNGRISIAAVTIKGHKTNAIRGKYMAKLDSLGKTDFNPDYVCEDWILNCQYHGKDAEFNIKPIDGVWYLKIIGYRTPLEHIVPVSYSAPKWSEAMLLEMNNLSVVKAFNGNRKFYQPNYDKEAEANVKPDFRNTLLWAPDVITNSEGEATLSFFCSDINTDFIGRIEGVDGNGLLGTGFFKFTVRKLKLNP